MECVHRWFLHHNHWLPPPPSRRWELLVIYCSTWALSWCCWKQLKPFPKKVARLFPFHPFLDKAKLLHVGGKMGSSMFSYSKLHPIILHGNHPVTIRSEHLRLLQAGPTLLISSLIQQFHIISLCKSVRFVTRQCVTCKHHSLKPHN